MQITHHKPVVRGVSQLMYVGDDQAVEQAIRPLPAALKVGLALLVGWWVLTR